MTEYQGLIRELAEDLYHSLPGLSSTGAKKILKSAAHYRHYADTPQPTKAEFDLGSIVHGKVLGVGAGVAIYPDGTGTEVFEFDGKELPTVLSSAGTTGTNAARAFAKDARENGLIPMKRADADVAEAMASSVLGNTEARKMFEEGEPELSMFATDPDTATPMRGRLDWLHPNRIIDLKTTAVGASEADFEVAAFRLGYDVQTAWYEHIYHLITGDTLPYLIVAVENTAPYLTGIHRFGDDELLMARRRGREARERYARCIETGTWPGYKTRNGGPIGILRAPAWNVNQYIDEYEGHAA